MELLLQCDGRWKNKKLGTCTDSICQSGCFVTSLSMLSGKYPDEVNDILRDNGGYSNGCLVVADRAAELLGLEYNGVSKDKPDYDCVAETHYFSPKVPQHFFVVKKDGSILDPLGKNIDYPIASYRLFKTNQEEDMDWQRFHEYTIHTIRKAREKLFGHVDDNGAEADSKLAEDKYKGDSFYELGDVIGRYVDSDEFKANWTSTKTVSKLQKTLDDTTVALQTANATSTTLNTELKRASDEITKLKKELEGKCTTTVEKVDICCGALNWFKNFFRKDKDV